MKKTLLLLTAIVCMAMHSSATTYIVTVADFSFSPNPIFMNPGDTIKWVWASGTHTTTSSTSIPSGAGSWNANISSASPTFIYIPSVPGLYNYYCVPHASMGMTGSFTVGVPTSVPKNNSAAAFSVFPNPAAGMLHLQFAISAPNTNITITDMTGKEAWKKSYESIKQTDIDITGIPNGLYVIKALRDGKEYHEQVTINH